jgi:hypothetical protein
MGYRQNTSARLIIIRLRLVVVEYDVKEKMTMNLQRSKRGRKTTSRRFTKRSK